MSSFSKPLIATSVVLRVRSPLSWGDRDREQNEAPIIQKEMLSDWLCHFDTHKCMGLDRIYSRLLKELAEELIKPLSIICQQPWPTRDIPADWRLAKMMNLMVLSLQLDLMILNVSSNKYYYLIRSIS